MFAPVPPSWRAALRIARRDVLRHKGRHALVALLVALPVFALSAADVVIRTAATPTAEDRIAAELGDSAQALLTWLGGKVVQDIPGDLPTSSGDDPGLTLDQTAARLRTALPAGSTLVPSTEYWTGTLRVGSRAVTTMVRTGDLAPLRGLYTVTHGRLPQERGEVAISSALAKDTGLAVGARLTTSVRTANPLDGATVTGIVKPTNRADGPLVYGPAGMLAATDQVGRRTFYVLGTQPVTWPDVLRLNDSGASVLSRAVLLDPPPPDQVPFHQQGMDDGQGGTSANLIVGAVAIVLTLLQIVLLAGPALAVGARRQERTLAIVLSAGGERRHARRVVLAGALLVGVVSSLVAAVLGVLAGVVLLLVLRATDRYVTPSVHVGWAEIGVLVLVGAGTAVAAALLPARQAARLDVIAALTGRRQLTALRRRVPVLGLALAVAGFAVAWVTASQRMTVPVALGLALGEIGLVATAGAAIALLARLARRAPLAVRVAVRDAARQRGRTAPAVAAVLAAVIGGLASVLFVGAQTAHDRAGYEPQAALGAVRVILAGSMGVTAPITDTDAARIEQALRGALPVDRVATLRSADQGVDALRSPGDQCPADVETTVALSDPRCAARRGDLPMYGGSPVVTDATALAILQGGMSEADRAALAAGKVLLGDPFALRPDGTAAIVVSAPEQPVAAEPVEPQSISVPAAVMTSPARYGYVVLPARVAERLGVTTRGSMLVASTTRLPTGAEQEAALARLQDLALPGDPRIMVERGYEDRFVPGMLALVGAALLIALVGSLTAVGLAAAEGRSDAATLLAVGASPGVRRRIAAGQAAVVVGLGVLLGSVGGLLAGATLVRQMASQGDPTWRFVVPWPYVLGIVVGIPLLTIAVAFLTARTKLVLTRRLAG